MVSFYPFRYNPQSNSIEVITNAQLRVDISEAGRVIEPQRKISRAFESIYKKMILNYDDISRDAEYQQPCYLLSLQTIARFFRCWKLLPTGNGRWAGM